LAKLSEKFGSVLRMPRYFRWFYLAEVFAAIAALAHLTQAATFLVQSQPNLTAQGNLLPSNPVAFALVFHHVPLAISVTIGILVTWKYWGWLITDRKK